MGELCRVQITQPPDEGHFGLSVKAHYDISELAEELDIVVIIEDGIEKSYKVGSQKLFFRSV